ncbi:MAG: LysM peptidoglycan-binding domain-containing protein [Chloroflexota bacterium]|nr:LysM peptidoglycan-binding domain-containing protein [Chloroflexota bacterium]
MKRIAIGLIMVAALIAAFASVRMPAQAQGNLLRDPGFEGPYVGRGRPDLNTSDAWSLWTTESPRAYEWQNRPDRLFGFPHPGGPEVHGGSASQNLSGGYVTFTAALFQQATVPANTDVTAGVWGRLKTCNLPRGQDDVLTGDNCGSAIESGGYVRVGIDPTGGTNPAAGTVIWSANITPHDRWEQAAVSAKSAATTVTVFAWISQQWPSDLNNVWFDDASLVLGIGAPGGVAQVGATIVPPTATPIPFAAFVNAQPPQADGSILHVVRQGDTLAAIAFAYGVSVEEIRELNNLRGTRWILVGQELKIQDASATEATPALTPTATLSSGTTGTTTLPTLPAQPFGAVLPTQPPRTAG